MHEMEARAWEEYLCSLAQSAALGKRAPESPAPPSPVPSRPSDESDDWLGRIEASAYEAAEHAWRMRRYVYELDSQEAIDFILAHWRRDFLYETRELKRHQDELGVMDATGRGASKGAVKRRERIPMQQKRIQELTECIKWASQ